MSCTPQGAGDAGLIEHPSERQVYDPFAVIFVSADAKWCASPPDASSSRKGPREGPDGYSVSAATSGPTERMAAPMVGGIALCLAR